MNNSSDLKKRYKRYRKPINYSLILAMICLFLGINISPNQNISSLFINLSSSFIFAIFAILIIDWAIEQNKLNEWKKVKDIYFRMIANNIEDLISQLETLYKCHPKDSDFIFTDKESRKLYYKKYKEAKSKNFRELIKIIISETKKLKIEELTKLNLYLNQFNSENIKLLSLIADKYEVELYYEHIITIEKVSLLIKRIDIAIEYDKDSDNIFKLGLGNILYVTIMKTIKIYKSVTSQIENYDALNI